MNWLNFSGEKKCSYSVIATHTVKQNKVSRAREFKSQVKHHTAAILFEQMCVSHTHLSVGAQATTRCGWQSTFITPTCRAVSVTDVNRHAVSSCGQSGGRKSVDIFGLNTDHCCLLLEVTRCHHTKKK